MASPPTGFQLLKQLAGGEPMATIFEDFSEDCAKVPDEDDSTWSRLVKNMRGLIKELKIDHLNRISSESYNHLWAYMQKNDNLFLDEDCPELIREVRMWLETYWVWSRTHPHDDLGQTDLVSLVSRWFTHTQAVESATNGTDSSSRLAQTVMTYDRLAQLQWSNDGISTTARFARAPPSRFSTIG